MSKGLRLSEAWFRRGLWVIALVFAGFLIGLGGTVVNDLPKVEKPLVLEDFLDRAGANRLHGDIKQAERTAREAQDALEQARLKLRVAQSDTRAAREGFHNWVATRRATQLAEQDPEVLSRTRLLDQLREAERSALSRVQEQEQVLLDAQQRESRARLQLQQVEQEAGRRMAAEARMLELRVFLYRLALTLPLLGVAGWLLKTRRQGRWWPFVWGFAFFAVFAFFVELVPYLPSYGGYVRYAVGIVLTVVVGRQVILALNGYLERQRAAERLPDAQRREELSYDTALARLGKGVCPGCERGVDLRDEKIDFCPHCGIGLHDGCAACTARKSAFARFCHRCGSAARPGSGAGTFTRLVPGPA
jgi:hypothetical protein